MSNVRKFAYWITTLSLVVIVSALVVEGMLRLIGTPTTDLYTVTEDQFNEVPGIYDPGQDVVRTVDKNLPHRVSINSLGYRGKEISPLKPASERRIFVAGDSFVFGEFVDDHETMPSQLEALLEANCNGVRVVNAGLLGGTIVGEAHLIERGLVLAPDLVVLVFHENDLENLYSPLWHGLERNRAVKSRFPMSFIYPLARDTAVWNFAMILRGKLRAEKAAREAGTKEQAVEPMEMESAGDVRATYSQELKKLRDFLGNHDVPLVFVTYPGHHAVRGRESAKEILRWAKDAAKDLGIPTLSLLDALQEKTTPDNAYLLPWDGHPSALGHTVAAREVARFVLQLPSMIAACP